MSPTAEQPEAAEQSADELTAAPEGEHRVRADLPDLDGPRPEDLADEPRPWDPAQATDPDVEDDAGEAARRD